MELLSKLGIDWKLLAAQIINFFILLFVLWKFVYKPVLDILDKRSKTIEKGIKDAKESEERLKKIEELKERKFAEAEAKIGQMFEEARSAAENIKKDIIAAANSQAEDLLRRSRIQIEEEKQKMVQDIKREISGFIVAAASKLLEREFSATDQKRLEEAVSQEMKSV